MENSIVAYVIFVVVVGVPPTIVTGYLLWDPEMGFNLLTFFITVIPLVLLMILGLGIIGEDNYRKY